MIVNEFWCKFFLESLFNALLTNIQDLHELRIQKDKKLDIKKIQSKEKYIIYIAIKDIQCLTKLIEINSTQCPIFQWILQSACFWLECNIESGSLQY